MTETFTAFSGHRIVARGTRSAVARALLEVNRSPVLLFSDESGRETDLDLSGGIDAVTARYGDQIKRGRPKLGVVAKEVTLLPRHWDWLSQQRGGASATLRRLVDQASKADAPDRRRDAAYRFCSAIAGDLPGFEEAMRQLYAGHDDDFRATLSDWPGDIRAHAMRLAGLD